MLERLPTRGFPQTGDPNIEPDILATSSKVGLDFLDAYSLDRNT